MHRRSDSWNQVIAAFVVGGCVLFAPACHPPKPKVYPHQNIDSLRDALQRAAASSLPTPTLSNRSFELTTLAEALTGKAAEITSIAKELKGTVLSSPASDSGANLLINMPANQVAEFARRIGQSPVPPADASELPVMVDVHITPSAP